MSRHTSQQPSCMAHSNENHDGENHAEDAEGPHQKVRTTQTILPPSNPDDVRVPYANELLLLSFEGQHKEFELPPEGFVSLIRMWLRKVAKIIKP